MKKNNVLYKTLKLPNIHPFVPKLVPGLGPSFKRSCIVEMLKEQKHTIKQLKPIISKILNGYMWKINSFPTLSSLELFMAFRAAESINIGGPSSNTSLMNSFACGQKI